MTTDTRPNVMLVVTDQQRWDTLSCAGGPVETANIDWWAAQGTRFTRAYTPVPTCIPARASLFTGTDPWNTGILAGAGQPPMANLHNTVPDLLSRAGYHTQGIGKMNFRPQRSLQGFHHTVLDEARQQIDPGFVSDYQRWFADQPGATADAWDHGLDANTWMARPYPLPEHLHPTSWTASQAVDFLRRRDPTTPFFMMVSFNLPHSPYVPPPFYYDLYANQDLAKPVVGDWAAVHESPPDAADPNAWRGRRSDAITHRARAAYYGSIHHIDHQIGRITRELRQQRVDDNTLIIFTSDHGDMLGDHHLWRKNHAYEGSSHISMVVRPPASMRDHISPTNDRPVCLQDVAPTILDVAGVDIPDSVDGASLVPLTRGEDVPWRRYVHGEHGGANAQMQYLTDGTWKYIWLTGTGAEQLFHLAEDPGETTDLSAEPSHADILARWRSELVATLAPRDIGLTDGAHLVPRSEPSLLSPHAAQRTY